MVKPLALVILDGWGYREATQYNAIAQANTPNWDRWWQQYSHTLLACSGPAVGLPEGQMGNSEVGHMHMGAGRIVDQDYTRINKAIDEGEFANNAILQAALKKAQTNGSRLHIIGLLSAGGVHSHERHIHALINVATNVGLRDINVHAILDGRDTPPKSATASLLALDDKLKELRCGQIASIIGRYYAMDRDQRWQRTQQAYDLYVNGKGIRQTDDALTALEYAYAAGETDEFVQASVTLPTPSVIGEGDVVINMNFRADRARQLANALTQNTFVDFDRQGELPAITFVTLTEYSPEIAAQVLFSRLNLKNTLGEQLSRENLTQLHIAETEKYAHVTYFFNGGCETVFPGEQRILVPSPDVKTYDEQPAMSAREITDKLCTAVGDFDVLIVNYANADMVGHTGNFAATVKAIEVLDECLGKLFAAVQKQGGEMLITADHGNADCMYDTTTGQAHTAHTLVPVPLLYLSNQAKLTNTQGSLIDIAPTILHRLGIPIPNEMTGTVLLK